jgi:nucleotide-binding universal stress UspA family protein
VDLIALASHGRGGLARVFYGSVAAGLLHRVDRPLLIIRSRKAD